MTAPTESTAYESFTVVYSNVTLAQAKALSAQPQVRYSFKADAAQRVEELTKEVESLKQRIEKMRTSKTDASSMPSGSGDAMRAFTQFSTLYNNASALVRMLATDPSVKLEFTHPQRREHMSTLVRAVASSCQDIEPQLVTLSQAIYQALAR